MGQFRERHLRENVALRLLFLFAFAVALLGGGTMVASAQQAPPARILLAPAAPLPRDGTYTVGDSLGFIIDHHNGRVRLRFVDADEIFYLSNEAAPLGGRILKYDTGATALQVTGWGGVTLYTAEAQSGLPAEYADVVQNVDPSPVEGKDVKPFASRLAQELSFREDFAVGFAADWSGLAQNESDRVLGCDAMRNATYALQHVAKTEKRTAAVDKVHIVRVMAGEKPGAAYKQGVLTVTYASKAGAAARPSSLAIAKVLMAAL
jgi:Domain of unknown function (DUF4908)